MTAPLMSGFKEGQNNDWAPTVNGFIVEEFDLDMLRQQINARIQTLPNEVDGFDAAVDYINIIFGDAPLQVKQQVIIEAIKSIPAVNEVLFVSAQWIDKPQGIFGYNFMINTIFGALKFAMSVDAQNQKIGIL